MADKMLAVVGATGRTGVPLVTHAVDRGHRIRALVRDAAKADRLLPTAVEVVVGDATDPDDLRRLVEGADVVLDVSGPVRGGPPGYRERSTHALLAALDDVAPGARLVHLTGAGVRRPGDRPGLADRLVRGLMQVVARPLLQDATAAVDAAVASGRDVLVVRAPRLTDREPSGGYRTAPAVGVGSGLQIARADLATALLDLAEVDTWPDGAPVVSAR